MVSIDKIQLFLSHLTSKKTIIQITVEVEIEIEYFFDVDIMHHSGGSLTTTVYSKKTHTEKYLAYNSYHPTALLIAIYKSRIICSTIIQKEERMRTDKEWFKSQWLSQLYH